MLLAPAAKSPMAIMGKHLLDRIETAAPQRWTAWDAGTEELANLLRTRF